jgi:hypothetical protein
VQVADVVEQGGAELLDGVFAHGDLVGPMPSSRKLSVKLRARKITA